MNNPNELFKHLSQISEALNSLSKNSGQFFKSLESLSSFFYQPDMKDLLKKEEVNKTVKKTTATKKEVPKITGDPFYDIFNSPNMMNIVKEVMKKRNK